MRRILTAFAVMILTAGMAAAETRVLTSFYPMYVFAKELTAGAEGVTVFNMAEQSTGCLHDYQLGQRDAAAVSEADVMIINGGGMEQFVDRIREMRPDMPVIAASDGIALQDSCEAGMKNAHVWLSPELAACEIRTIAEGLASADPAHAALYRDNADRMTAELNAADGELSAMLAPAAGHRVITFHEAFNYFLEAYGITVADVIAHEPGEAPSTREIAETCDRIRAEGVDVLFTEPQYPTQAADIISRETGTPVRQMDTGVSGDGSWDGYLGMLRGNAAVLLEALTHE